LGITDRAYGLLRAYIGREWDRIERGAGDARRELDEYLDSGKGRPAPEQERPVEPKASPGAPLSETEEAYRVLKLDRSATLADLKQSHKTLSERSLPANFPEDSEERKQAEVIHARVQKAYDHLLPILDPRLRRFRSLWIE
jgi:hypothetical protein